MPTTRLITSLLMMATCSSVALAADAPNLVGKWKGEATVVHLGTTPHRTPSKEGPNFALDPLPVVFDIVEQKANHFHGTFKIRSTTETVIGSVRSDGKDGIMIDDDGQWFFTLSEPDKMDLCYYHVTATNKVVGCFPVRREK